jgi:small subunit ribosomal protein S6
MPVRPYEVVYIIDPDLSEDQTSAVVERFRALAEAQGAEDLRVDTRTLGRRRLAYAIKHKREGHYVIMNFQSEAAAPAEVERVLQITDGILRSMVVRLDEMPEELPEPEPEAPTVDELPEVVEEEPATVVGEEDLSNADVLDTEAQAADSDAAPEGEEEQPEPEVEAEAEAEAEAEVEVEPEAEEETEEA